MLSYYLKCREKTGSKNSRAVKTKNIRVLPNWVVCGSKKTRLLKRQEAKGIISGTSSKIPILGPLFK